MLGMSAVPNHAPRTASGFAATAAPAASLHANGARISSTAPSAPSVVSRTKSR
jgi:hypothetical protein